jgi:hypothetical protein
MPRAAIKITTLAVAAGAAATVGIAPVVAATPGSKPPCVVSKRAVHRGDLVAVSCRRTGQRNARGVLAYYGADGSRLRIRVFHTGKRGNAVFSFHVLPKLPLGHDELTLSVGTKQTSVLIVVKRATSSSSD